MDRHACSNEMDDNSRAMERLLWSDAYVTTEISYSRTGAPSSARSTVSINGIFRAIFSSTLMHIGTSILPQACRSIINRDVVDGGNPIRQYVIDTFTLIDDNSMHYNMYMKLENVSGNLKSAWKQAKIERQSNFKMFRAME